MTMANITTKQKFFQLLFIVLIIAVIYFIGFMIVWLNGTSKECVADPLTFYAENTNQSCDAVIGGWELKCVVNWDGIPRIPQINSSLRLPE